VPVVGSAWAETPPTESIHSLSTVDIDSIRDLLKGDLNPLWPNAIRVLGFVGGEDDVGLIKKSGHIELPTSIGVAAVADRQRQALLLKTKFAVPGALAAIAARANSRSAIEELKSLSYLENGNKVAGTQVGRQLSRAALFDIAGVNNAYAKATLSSILLPMSHKAFQLTTGQSKSLSDSDIEGLASQAGLPTLSATDLSKLLDIALSPTSNDTDSQYLIKMQQQLPKLQ
jgi:hypothetical protein